MTRFVDVYLDDCVPGYPVLGSPRWSTDIAMADGGDEQVNERWAHPLNRYTLPEAVRTMTVFNAIRDHWLVMRGPAHTWPFRDPLDFASVPLAAPNTAPAVTPYDQDLGIGDGVTRTFQMQKTYARGAQEYVRTIALPVVASVRIGRDGASSPPQEMLSGWSVSRTTGIVTFDTAPANGEVLTWGGYFDVPVRFESDDSFDGIVRTFGVGGFADITLLETRSC